MPTLGNLENLTLMMLQQPGYNFDNAVPDWNTLTNPQYPQSLVDYILNQAYRRVASDLANYNLLSATFTLTSSLGVGSYPIPPLQATNPFPEVRLIKDVFYLPIGQTQAMRFEPGSQLVSWTQFMQMSGQGYNRANSGSAWPSICAMGPTRKTLEFYPNPVQNGDVITVYYAPLPTVFANQCATLAAEDDAILLPSDVEMAIIYWALHVLFRRNSDDKNSDKFMNLYKEEIARVKMDYQRDSAGDALVMTDIPTFPALASAPWLV